MGVEPDHHPADAACLNINDDIAVRPVGSVKLIGSAEGIRRD
jgi:hypothetical protein